MPFKPFQNVSGILAHLPSANIDTDVIMPKTFLKGIDRSGLDVGLFHYLRFDQTGDLQPDFILNRAPWDHATFLVAGDNFGCGSSREHAVWGLQQFGFRAIIAPSFAGIFFDNCARNGLLAIKMDATKIQSLFASAKAATEITIDLEQQIIKTSEISISFDIDQRRKKMVLLGQDEIDATLLYRDEIEKFQSNYFAKFTWLTESN